MPKCICVRDCYLSTHEGARPVYYQRGQVVNFEECPDHFMAIEEAVVPVKKRIRLPKAAIDAGQKDDGGSFDFESATEEVLMAAEYDLEQLKAYGMATYGATFDSTDVKAAVVAKYVDARYRNYVSKTALHAVNENMVK